MQAGGNAPGDLRLACSFVQTSMRRINKSVPWAAIVFEDEFDNQRGNSILQAGSSRRQFGANSLIMLLGLRGYILICEPRPVLESCLTRKQGGIEKPKELLRISR